MAPLHNNQLRLSLSTHRRCSKSQMCFFKILHIISVLPPDDVTDIKCSTHNNENKGFDVDLNITLRPVTDIEPFDAVTTAYDCDRNKIESNESELAVEDERLISENSEISHVEDQNSGIDFNGASKPRDEGYLDLLIEAAQLILGDDSQPDIKPPSVPKRKQQCWTAATEAEWYAEFEDTSPVVKSKRGRNQVLPYKYRDSVVEPLVRWPTSNHRSIGNATGIVRSKRRSK